MISSSNKDFEV